jgi:prophage antirepressor-like protein
MNESSSLEPFQFNEFEIRFVGTPDEPEWVGADVVAVLYPEADARNYSNYLSRVPDEWKGHRKIMTLGGPQDMATLFEPGLYALIARSNSPLAVPFQKWVYEDVLPSIRKTGSYSTTQNLIPPAKERLENIRLGMDLLYELGGVDERTQLALRDIVRDVLLEDRLKKPALPGTGRSEWPVSDRARHLGFNPDRTALMKIGRTAAKLYRLAHNGEDPPQREQFVDGTTRMVKCYGEADLDILDSAISLVMTPPSTLPPADDSDDEF